jgi:hypothetical protein
MRGLRKRVRRVDEADRGVKSRIVLSALLRRAAIVAAGCGVFELAIAGPAQAAVSVPNGSLKGVSCASATACSAVGNGYGTGLTLAERWNGASWAVQATPNPTGATFATLSAVSCPSERACTAVGSYTSSTGQTMPLAERFNGTSWEIQATPTPTGATSATLSGVSCTAARACTAVGYAGSASQATMLAERWNGTSWEIQATPTPAGGTDATLSAVSCTTATGCTAVGNYFISSIGQTVPFAERSNGAKWVVQTTPDLGHMSAGLFTAVSCVSARACIGSGGVDYGGGVTIPLTERWNGTSWAVIQSRPESGAVLYGVSCTSETTCTAVGIYDVFSVSGQVATIAERWDGTSWSIQPTADPTGSTYPTLYGVSCMSAKTCTAVGSYNDSTGQAVTLAERWDGTSWVIQPTP